MPRCTVIIPTHNRRDALELCLAGILKQTITDFSVIVINDASTDDTALWLANLSDPRILSINLPTNVGVAVARNTAAEQATGDILVFLDDDCIPDPAWLSEILEKFSENSVKYAWGRTDYRQAGYVGHFPERVVTNQKGNWPGSGNFAIRAEVFRLSGGFDPAFLQYQNEDSEFAIRLAASGYHWARVPSAVVFHQAGEWTVRKILGTRRNGSVWPILKKKFPQQYRVFRPNILGGVIVQPFELLTFFLWPVLVPILLVRYWLNGKRNLAVFFAKWPLLIILRRLYIWREAVRQGVFML